ncbi:MAG TPA: twin-arginine translocation signal domain-containing protein [Terracidiphilus sp.]|jgi:quercetin dioxygenase-like cupin family protein
MDKSAITNPDRRDFLRAAPAVAAAGLALADSSLFSSAAAAQDAAGAGAPAFQLFTAEALHGDIDALGGSPGNKNLVGYKGLTVVLTTEKMKSGKEFEWHEGRDHVFHILEGSTVYEIGGTPKNGHSTGPGEWLAPESEGATTYTLNKGDMLVIRRGTAHKRTTKESVTFMLISAQEAVKA